MPVREWMPDRMLRSLLRRRDLTRQLAWRAFTSRYKGSWLGLGWSLLYPLLLLAIYTLVFGFIFGGRWARMSERDPVEYALALFCGLVPFTFFSECVTRAPGIVVAVPNYVKKVVFPLEVLPVAEVLAALAHMAISLGLLVAGTAVFLGPGRLDWTLALLPLAVVPLVALVLGLTWFLASLGVFVRDIGPTVILLSQAMLFLTPVFYEIDNPQIPGPMRQAMRLNPLAPIVESFRRAVLWGEAPPWAALGAAWAVAAVVLVAGYAWFLKSRRAFSDVL